MTRATAPDRPVVDQLTVTIPVRDLAAARTWYQRLLGAEPELAPAPGLVEFRLGTSWLQLRGGDAGAGGWVLRLGIGDVRAAHARLARLGLAVEPIETVPGVIRYFEFRDPDGNRLSFYELL